MNVEALWEGDVRNLPNLGGSKLDLSGLRVDFEKEVEYTTPSGIVRTQGKNARYAGGGDWRDCSSGGKVWVPGGWLDFESGERVWVPDISAGTKIRIFE